MYVRLRRLLGWSNAVQVTGVSIRTEGNDQAISTLPELWQAIESHEVPMLWLQTAGMSPKSPKTQPQRQRPYSEHPVLRLEAFLNELTDVDARLASPMFALVRQNHVRSNNHIEDIEDLFAPVRKRNADAWAQAEQVSEVLGEMSKGQFDVLKLEAWTGDLDQIGAGDARAIFHVIRRNYKTGNDFADALSAIFAPVKQGNIEERERFAKLKSVFDDIDKMKLSAAGASTWGTGSIHRESMTKAQKRKSIDGSPLGRRITFGGGDGR